MTQPDSIERENAVFSWDFQTVHSVQGMDHPSSLGKTIILAIFLHNECTSTVGSPGDFVALKSGTSLPTHDFARHPTK